MHYHVILTKECNLDCRYCGGGSDSEPKEIQYSIPALGKFISRDTDPVIEFYGGEPLLRIDTMEKIMDAVKGQYVIQTNGLYLDRIPEKYLEKFHSILVSIDGKKEITDSYRGGGVYERVIRNIRTIKEKGFSSDIVARMTVPEGSDIYENVLHLAGLEVFDHVHWQLGFDMFWEGGEPGLEDWIDSYNSGISSLVMWWIKGMENGGVIHGIVPFIGIMDSLLKDDTSLLRCGSGIDFFSIMPDGRISACPVSIDYEFSIIGSIYDDTPLRRDTRVGEPCTSCEIFGICGGRCLFVNHAQDMLGDQGYALICKTVKHLVRELQKVLPHVRELIENGTLNRSDFEYPEINNGCEIIP